MPAESLQLTRGAITTSGDARRYVMHRGKRLSHVLNPRTGWPVSNAPSSVTVLGETCTQTGLLSTLAILKRKRAKAFLKSQNVRHLVQRQ